MRNKGELVQKNKGDLALNLGTNCISELGLQLDRSHQNGGGMADLTFEIRGDFREKVISTFSSPF
ncbi:FOG: GGDEF domain [Moritella viscosa]|nr:FOG: GGDEF domain [Moritella viscosa]